MSVKRVMSGIVFGAMLGAGTSAGVFGTSWPGEALENGESSNGFMALLGLLLALHAWSWARAEYALGRIVRAWLIGATATMGAVACGWLVAMEIRQTTIAAWFLADLEFLTLVGVCIALGVATFWWCIKSIPSLMQRAGYWISASFMCWFSAEWLVKLGPSMERWSDPREGIALWTMIFTGGFAFAGIIALMDWHIRWREAEQTPRVETEASDHG